MTDLKLDITAYKGYTIAFEKKQNRVSDYFTFSFLEHQFDSPSLNGIIELIDALDTFESIGRPILFLDYSERNEKYVETHLFGKVKMKDRQNRMSTQYIIKNTFGFLEAMSSHRLFELNTPHKDIFKVIDEISQCDKQIKMLEETIDVVKKAKEKLEKIVIHNGFDEIQS